LVCLATISAVESIVALLISVVALVLTLLQIRVARGGNHLPVVLEAFKESRTPEWFRAQEYILGELARDYDVDCGWRGLPEPARAHVNTIGLFYDDLGKLAAHDLIDEDLIIGSYGETITRLWDALAPYIYEERRAYMPHHWTYFEDLAARAARRGPEVVYAELGLRRRPPDRNQDLPEPSHEAPRASARGIPDERSVTDKRPGSTPGSRSLSSPG
jgi:hypothetical protein